MSNAMTFSTTAESLRLAFDQSFAVAPRSETVTTHHLLAIRVGSASYAVRLVDVQGIITDKRVVRLPSGVPELVGLASLRGEITPVYDLGLLLGHRRVESPRWLIAASGARVALAVDGLDGQLAVPSTAFLPAAETSEGHVVDLVTADGVIRPVIALAALVEGIRNRVQRTDPREER